MPFSTYLPEHMGSIRLTPSGPFVAGAYAELTLTYTAGTFGIDDTGMVKISWRTTSDMSKPQFDKPAAPNFTTVEASNGAKLDVWFDRLNIRPYANTLLIRVGRGYLRAGDTLTVRMGDRRQGSPGYRLQTNCEARVELKTSIDAFATYEFTELPEQPAFALVPGPARALEGDLALARGGRRVVPPRHHRRGCMGQPDGRGRADARARVVTSDPRIAAKRRDQARRRPARAGRSRRRRGRRSRLAARGERRGARARQPAARRHGRAAAALLGRPARAERRNHRHGLGGKLFPLCARFGLHRHGRPPGQRFSDHRRVLGRAQSIDRGVRCAGPFRVPAGLRVVGQHRHGRRPQHLLPARRPPDPALVAHPGRRADLEQSRLHGRRALSRA